MLASEMIEKLQDFIRMQGDCEIVVDSPHVGEFIFDFQMEGKWYTYGARERGKPYNQIYIILPDNP